MTHLGLFEGIGGFSLAAKWMGWHTKAWCEINPFGQQVLKYYYPEAEAFTDIKKSDFKKYANRIDILTGGFPCQPYSQAGKRLGKEDERHLWPEMLRAIREVQPRYVVGENVRGLTNWNGGMVFDEVQADLEFAGYEVLPFLLPACAKDAPHRRDRIWFIAYDNERECRQEGRYDKMEYGCPITNTESINAERSGRSNDSEWQSNKEIGSRLWGEPGSIGTNGNAANTNEKRFQRQGESAKLGRRGFSKHDAQNHGSTWDNFPTQPPLCSRNDGLSTELSGITFSKHRNESIKAYGNAIVPQVAFEIFKSIQAFENIKTATV